MLIDVGAPWVPANDLLWEQVWADAPRADIEAFTLMFTAAQQQCETYAKALVPNDDDEIDVPENYRLALILQTRSLWQVAVTDPSGMIGADGFQVRLYPMDWNVKKLLRPGRAVPAVG